MFVIAGITGQIGAVVAETLAAQGHEVRALLRDPGRHAPRAGISPFAADLGDVAALTRAFAGAQAAWMLAPPTPTEPDPVGRGLAVVTAIRAASRAAGLKRLVFLSSEAAQLARGNGPIRMLHLAEAVLADAAPEVTFLRPSYFQENWKSVLPLARAEGVLPSFTTDPDARHSMIATRDIGVAAAALLLEQPAPPRVVELASATAYSARDAASAAGLALGREVRPVMPPRDAWQGMLEGAGLHPDYAALLVEMYDGINSGLVRHEGTGRRITGQTTLEASFRAWL